MQGKKHIIITGAIGSGKTTLLKKLRDKMGFDNSVPALITWNEQGKGVYMRRADVDEAVMIGAFDCKSLSTRNRMKPIVDGFNIRGYAILESFINCNSKWVTIDEIGFLECDCQPYIGKLMELFENKRVMAVVRKQDIKHINDILRRDDVFVIDLDEEGKHENNKSNN